MKLNPFAGQRIELTSQITRADGTVEPVRVKAIHYTNPLARLRARRRGERLPGKIKVAKCA